MTVALPIRRPLLNVWAVMAILDRAEWQVEQMIDRGELAYVFNIATPGAGRRCLRIATESVGAVVRGVKEERTFEEVAAVILPGHAERIPATRIARAFG